MLAQSSEKGPVRMAGPTHKARLTKNCVVQDLVVYCNATQNQFYGDSGVNYNTNVFTVTNPGTTDNAINCCLRCAFSDSCNIW